MRKASIKRETKETNIVLELNLDGNGKCDIATGVGFFDHMLELFAVHGGFDLKVSCKGDTHVDGHHSVEDIGITLGQAISEALGDKKGIARYASVSLPMDETLCRAALDVSGRPFLVFNAALHGACGDYDAELTEEFFRAVTVNGGLTLHVNVEYGGNNHHVIEAIFKAFARSLSAAVKIVGDKIPSSKGVL